MRWLRCPECGYEGQIPNKIPPNWAGNKWFDPLPGPRINFLGQPIRTEKVFCGKDAEEEGQEEIGCGAVISVAQNLTKGPTSCICGVPHDELPPGMFEAVEELDEEAEPVREVATVGPPSMPGEDYRPTCSCARCAEMREEYPEECAEIDDEWENETRRSSARG